MLRAEQRLAGLLVDRYDLAPPVDVVGMLGERAELAVVDWRFDCDALVLGLTRRRPKVFLRGDVDSRRQRFTAAHELGHIEISWHIGAIACHSVANLPSWLLSGREAEASRFASALLVPVRFLAEVVAGSGDVGEWLELLSVADVSAVAGTIALAQSLPPGYLFVVELPAGPREIRSPGTSVALKWPDGLPDYGQLEGRAAACGRTGHQGRWVRWYRFVDDQLLPEPDDDPRSTTDLLRAAASRAGGATPDGRQLFNVANGLVGKAADQHPAPDAAALYGTFVFTMQSSPEASVLLADPDFERYLARRARELADRRQTRG